MVIYAICHSTALSQDFLHRHSSYSDALKTFSGFQSKGLNTQDKEWMCTGVEAAWHNILNLMITAPRTYIIDQ